MIMKGKENKKVKEIIQKNAPKNGKEPVNTAERDNITEIVKHPKSGKGL